MFANETALVNAALADIGESEIADYATDNERRAVVARATLPSLIDTLLTSHPWRFASNRVRLVASANAPDSPWSYRFAYPSALYVHAVMHEGQRDPRYPRVPFEISYDSLALVRTIQCDLDTAYALVTYLITNPAKWPQAFSDAVEWQLAAKLALRLARDKKMRLDTLQLAREMLDVAKAADLNENYAEPLEPETIRARR